MKRSLLVVFVAALFALFSPSARAADETAGVSKPAPTVEASKPTKKPLKQRSTGEKAAAAGEVTLKGQLTCAKCGLHESSFCQNVLRVPEAGTKTETKYYLTKNDVAQAHHEEVCGNQVDATVTGRVTDESGKKVLTASAITLD